MPPRKRKAAVAAPTLQAIAESPVEQEQSNKPTELSVQRDLTAIDEQVETMCSDILRAAQTEASAMRSEAQLQCIKIPKKVRDMSVADFFSLTAEDATATQMTNVLSRLQAMLEHNGGASIATAPTMQRVTRKALSTNPEPTTSSKPMPATATSRRTKASVSEVARAEDNIPCTSQGASIQASGILQEQKPAAAELMPPPPLPMHTSLRQPHPGEVAYSSNGSPLAVPRRPPQDQHGLAAVHATPGPSSLVAATPAGLLATAAQAPGAMLTGFTLMKKTVVKGRTRRNDENAIVISTADGKQFMVDAGTGLATVPDKYRKEVAQQLEVMQKLAAAALGRK